MMIIELKSTKQWAQLFNIFFTYSSLRVTNSVQFVYEGATNQESKPNFIGFTSIKIEV